MCGPIFGASGKINIAFYDALKAMSQLCSLLSVENDSAAKADKLKENMRLHLWSKDSQILRMSDLIPLDGICQDIHAYGLTTGIVPPNSEALSILKAPGTGNLPLAFQNIERWDARKIVSPYASGFAAEALFVHNQGPAAVELIERVWGAMVDPANPDYSGGLWEAMTEDGKPVTDDTSLMHGWSTWPVFLLPQYLAGLKVLEPGWKRFKIQPVLADIESVDVNLSTPAGEIGVSLCTREAEGTGELNVIIPRGTVAEVHAPDGWKLKCSKNTAADVWMSDIVINGQSETVQILLSKAAQVDRWNDKRAFETQVKKDGYEENTSVESNAVERPSQDETNFIKRFLRRIAKILCK